LESKRDRLILFVFSLDSWQVFEVWKRTSIIKKYEQFLFLARDERKNVFDEVTDSLEINSQE
jgi:hypothetical protein